VSAYVSDAAVGLDSTAVTNAVHESPFTYTAIASVDALPDVAEAVADRPDVARRALEVLRAEVDLAMALCG
jgi:isopentenyl diphosphate isomerase/L-lactate dehydrogenase-like FMN-dependent dehydrogenase